MEVQKRLYTVDDVCELQGWDGTRDRKYELIDGELIEMSPTNLLHQWLASELSGEIRNYAKRNDLGFVGVEGGFSPIDNRHPHATCARCRIRTEGQDATASAADIRGFHAVPRRGDCLAKQYHRRIARESGDLSAAWLAYGLARISGLKWRGSLPPR